ncbi:uncharacterized protein LOC102804095, partial [Saccoglossus kowalevskii]|uniref:Uncharacterized protein LOC102804095 n=1 Tax=Saccoglossus kowalevskii TaxID=10224 RepID=A0ABM0MIK9_SACKO
AETPNQPTKRARLSDTENGAESPIHPAKRARLRDTENEDRLTEGASSSKNPAVSRETELRNMLFHIAKELGEDDFKSLKEQCDVYQLIPKGDLEKKTGAYKVFESLREQSKISIDNTKLLEQLLRNIMRNDLVERFVSPFTSMKQFIEVNQLIVKDVTGAKLSLVDLYGYYQTKTEDLFRSLRARAANFIT